MALDRRTISRFLARHRRGASASFAALAVVCLGLALRPAEVPMVSVPVADRPLPPGHRLAAADLRVQQVAAAIVPTETAVKTAAELVGRVLAAPVLAGEPIVGARLVDSDAVSWVGPPGTDPLPLRFADPGPVDLIDAGQRLDVLAAADAAPGESLPRAQVVAAGVLVLAVVRDAEASEESLMGSTAPGPSGDRQGRSDLVIVAATPEQALDLAAAEAGRRLTFSIRSRDDSALGASPG